MDFEHNEAFTIDNDTKADWALRRIREEREELARLETIAQDQIGEIVQRLEAARNRCEQSTGRLLGLLDAYFDTVPHKSTKTQDKYQLLSGALVRKRGGIDYQRDDAALVDWMMDNDYDEMVTMTTKPQWGSFKRLLHGDPETGVVTLADTGEVVPGLTAIQKPDTFDVKY